MAANIYNINQNDLLREGLKIVGVSAIQQTRRKYKSNVRSFKEHFGRHPLHMSRTWSDLQKELPPDLIMSFAEAQEPDSLVGFLAAAHMAKQYCTGKVHAARFGRNEKTIAAMTWLFSERIAALAKFKIAWPTNISAVNAVSTDGVEFHNVETRHPEYRRPPSNFSRKGNGSGLTYALALLPFANRIVHVSRQGPGNMSDVTQFRSQLRALIPVDRRVICDKVYHNKEDMHLAATPNPLDTKEVKIFKSRVRARHETLHSRIKAYSCFCVKFRHGNLKHEIMFLAVIVMLQYAIEDTGEHGEPLFVV